MSKLQVCLFLAAVAASGCAKSTSADVTQNAPGSAAAAPAPAVASGTPTPSGSAASGTSAASGSPATPSDACDDACTKVAICYERVHKDETFRDGDGCVEHCNAMPAADRATWIADVVEAHRTNQCARLVEEDGDTAQASLAAGEPKLGCFAWSSKLNAAACVVGNNGSLGTHVRLALVGSTVVPLSLVDVDLGGLSTIEPRIAGKANDLLAQHGFTPLAGKAAPLKVRAPKQLAGVTLTLSSTKTDRGGDNVAPAYDNRIVATCGGREVELFRDDGEGVTAKASARAVGTYALVEVSVNTGREGEFDDALHAIVLDSTSCKVSTSIP